MGAALAVFLKTEFSEAPICDSIDGVDVLRNALHGNPHGTYSARGSHNVRSRCRPRRADILLYQPTRLVETRWKGWSGRKDTRLRLSPKRRRCAHRLHDQFRS